MKKIRLKLENQECICLQEEKDFVKRWLRINEKSVYAKIGIKRNNIFLKIIFISYLEFLYFGFMETNNMQTVNKR